MKFEDKYKVSNEFADLYNFTNKEEEIEHEAYMIMFRFLSELENLNSGTKLLKKKELAQKLGVSASYITQLFNGTKLINLITLAKIERELNITFEVKASRNETLYSEGDTTVVMMPFKHEVPVGFHVSYRLKPDYEKKWSDPEPEIVAENNPKYMRAI